MNKVNHVFEQHFDAVGYISTAEYIKQYASTTVDERFSMPKILKKYKTIAVVAMAYPSKPISSNKIGYGVLSRYSYGTDYHKVMNNAINCVVEELRNINIHATGFVDISPLNERVAAVLANLGYIGHNQFLIHDKFGTYMYLGAILIDRSIKQQPYNTLDDCGSCTRCIEACPTNALSKKQFYQTRCLSYKTQAKIPFDEETISQIDYMVYGCDICQNVCPKNTKIDYHLHKEFEPNGKEIIDLKALLRLSNKEYKRLYGDNASSWKGALVMKRNALCVLYNQQDLEALPYIKETLKTYNAVSWYEQTARLIYNKMKGMK